MPTNIAHQANRSIASGHLIAVSVLGLGDNQACRVEIELTVMGVVPSAPTGKRLRQARRRLAEPLFDGG